MKIDMGCTAVKFSGDFRAQYMVDIYSLGKFPKHRLPFGFNRKSSIKLSHILSHKKVGRIYVYYSV